MQYTDELSRNDLVGNKCRSSQFDDLIIWNCWDMMCKPGCTVCGFSISPAMYGTEEVMAINTNGISHINNNDFLSAWIGDATPQQPQPSWGMDQSNAASLNDTHGVFCGSLWRGLSDESFVSPGNTVGLAMLGVDKPVATRMGPLLTTPKF